MNDNQPQQQSQTASPAGFDLAEQALPWQDFLFSVFRHRRIVVVLLMLGILGGSIRAWTLPPNYTASARLMVRDSRARITVSPDQGTDAVRDRTPEQMGSLIALVRSPALVQEILVDLGWNASPQPETNQGILASLLSLPSKLYRRFHHVPAPSPIESASNWIANAIEASPVGNSNVIHIGYSSSNPEAAANLINRLIDKLIAKYTSLYDTTVAQRFYRDQRAVLSTSVDSAQTALNAFAQRVGSELLTLNPDQLRARIAALEEERASTKTEIAELRARREAPPETIYADATSGDTSSGIIVNPAVSSIKARLVELEIRRGELLTRYAPKSMMIADINQQITEARRLLAQERANTIEIYRKDADARIAATQARIDALGQQITEYRGKLVELEAIAPEWERLQNELDTQRQAYQTYLRKEEEVRFSNALDEQQILNVTVVEPARVPRDPEASPFLKLIVVGAGLGLALGVGLALLRDWLDPSVKTTTQAERLTGVPVLGEIPL
jgi:uncharacterized protein involved in exopolysaccharide biosynthesis